MNQQNKSNLESDISIYLKMGWPILPLHYPKGRNECSCGKKNCNSIGKHPLTKNGLKDATLDEAVIESWQRRWDFFNVGVLTDNLVVVDVDPCHGGDDSLFELEKKYTPLPDTVITLTGGGGQHYFFKAPDNQTIKNKVSLLPGLDIRTKGGYVVAPHSLHRSGQNYYFEAGYGPEEIAVERAPNWLIQLLADQVAPGGMFGAQWKPSSSKIKKGCRNKSIASLSGYLLRRYVEPYLTLELVQSWNQTKCDPPLDSSEVLSVVNSISGLELKRRLERGSH